MFSSESSAPERMERLIHAYGGGSLFVACVATHGPMGYPNSRLLMSPSHFHHPLGTYSSVTVMNT
jgi:hypothetical protein